MRVIVLALFLATSLLMTVIIPADATAPAGSFVSAVTSGTAPLTVQFIDSSSNTPSSWAWSFGDGGTSSEQNPAHTYSTAGSYTVTLTVTNADGSDTVSHSGYITVTETVSAPAAAFVASVTSGTAPLTVQFADSSTNTPASWVWSFGDGGTSTEQNPSHTYSSAGSFTVTLTAINAGGSTTISRPAYVVVSDTAAVPVAAFVTATTSGAVPFTVQFADASTNTPASWVWSFGDGSTSTDQNPSHTYTAAGTYTVTLTATNSAGSDTISEAAYITVTDAEPVASFTANVTSGTAPLAVLFTDTSDNSPTSWLWYFGDGGSSAEQNPAYEYEYAGTYTVTLTATNSAGSNTTYTSECITVTAPSVPVTSFTADTRTGTIPVTIQFTDTSTNAPTSWLWSFGDGSSSTEQNPAHIYTYAGTFTVSLTAYNAEGSRTSSASDYITTYTGTTTTAVPTVSLTTMTATIPVTAATTTLPVTAIPEITPWPADASPEKSVADTADLLIPAGAVTAVAVLATIVILRWRRNRYQRWDL